MTYVDLIAELSDRLGVEAPAVDPDVSVDFEIDDDLVIRVSPIDDGAGVELSAAVGEVPADPDADFFEALLSANADPSLVGAAGLAVDDVAGGVVLRRVLISLVGGAAMVEAELSRFAQVANDWTERLGSGRLRDETVASGIEDETPRSGGYIAV